MLTSHEFDLWADGYDRSVGLSDDQNTYPFAGYRRVLGDIYSRVMQRGGGRVLDLGFGTAVLTGRLCQQGCTIYGQDFSARMTAIAREKMPTAHLYQGDLTQGLVAPLMQQRYNAIIATYALHHLTDDQKIRFLHTLVPLLAGDGCILIGDVAFAARSDLERCRASCGDDWDEEEFYFVHEELTPHFPDLTFTPHSACAGVLELRR